MKNLFEKLQAWLSSLQNSSDDVKRRWVIGLSSVASFVVIVLWIGYAQLTITTPESPNVKMITQTPSIERSLAKENSEENPSAFREVGRRIQSGASRFMGFVADLFGRTHSIEIEGKDNEDGRENEVPSDKSQGE